ncbi:MAG: LysR family transcriptional regulator [Deltaproteobacteria bacterium]|nr:LysR family transcriptional regulator [Deltaproteobacteria bacterium]
MRKGRNAGYSRIDFDLRQLEIFCKVVEMESFSKAASEVCLAQASVSERVANLERMVGTRLLDRLGRMVVPTRAGERLYQQAQPLLDMKRAVCQDMEGFLGVQQGELNLGGSTIPGEYLLPSVLGRFHDRFPAVGVRLEIADSVRIQEGVLNGRYELGVVGSRSRDSRLIHEALWGDELVLAVRADHRWAGRESVSREELFGEPFILREEGSGTQRTLEDHLREADGRGLDTLRVSARLGTSTAVKEGVKAGLGVAFLSHHALATETEQGTLETVRLEGRRMVSDFFMIRDKRRTASPLCRTMASFLAETARGGAPETRDSRSAT